MGKLREILCCRYGCLKKVSNGIVEGLERFFYNLGGLVARHPWKTIVLCLLVSGLMGVGLIRWKEERRYITNFLPYGSRMLAQHDWIAENFPRVRIEALILQDENILTAQSINAVFDIYQTAMRFQTKDDKNVTEFCVRVGPVCQVSSILELWLYDEGTIRNLTDDDVNRTVNQETIISPLSQREVHLEKMLGHIKRGDNGTITGARATNMFLFLEGGSNMTLSALDWELQLITFVNEIGHEHLQKVFIYSARTYDDEFMGTLFKDLNLLFIGFTLVFIYLTASISQLSLVHNRILLGAAGLMGIGLAIAFTYGLGLAAGIMFGTIHQVLPFMLLGIGVDDIFVVIESLNNLTPKQQCLPVADRMALTMKNAGVSITVTSITDIVAFAIGGTTIIPALSTFCIYCAIGVFTLFVLQSTFFVACLTLEERRRDSRRDACFLCCKHKPTYTPNVHYKFSLQHRIMNDLWGPALTKIPVKVAVIIAFLGLTSLNTWSFLQIKFDYIPSKYLPANSYSVDFVKADETFFPDFGAHVELFCDEADYANNIERLLQLYQQIKRHPAVQPSTVDFWLDSYTNWLRSSRERRVSPYYMDMDEDAIKTSILIEDILDIDETDVVDAEESPTNASSNLPPRENVDLSSSNVKSSLYSLESSSKNTENRHVRPRDTKQKAVYDTMTTPSREDGTSSFNSSMTVVSSLPNITEYDRVQFVSSVCHFLHTQQGMLYQRAVKLDCWAADTNITGSVLTFNHVKCHSSQCAIDAMNGIRTILDGFTLRGGGTCFAYSDPQYMYNETNEVLQVELYRNLALAALSVFIVTLILITNMWTSILVFICVLCTVVDVAGTMQFLDISVDMASSVILILCFGLAVDYSAHIGHTFVDVAGTMQFWDISVDMASSVILILCFGLAVDYSAHIGHTFMTVHGSKNERLRKTLSSMGPAVFSGGISTFLAFSLLYFTVNYGFVLFFRIFTSVVIFGLFHGLVFLPVILSVVGPPPYETQLSNPSDLTSRHSDTASAMLPSCNGAATTLPRHQPGRNHAEARPMVPRGVPRGNGQVTIELQEPQFGVELDDSVFCNGNIWHSISDFDLDKDPAKRSPKSPRYSGSYYEQLSNGSWEEIPFTGNK